MIRLAKKIFRISLLGFMLTAAACAPTTQAPQPAPALTPTAALAGLAEPPEMTLVVNGFTQTGGTGSYCWNAQPENIIGRVDCVDVGGIPTSKAPLVLTDFPAQAEFRLASDQIPDSVILSVHPLTVASELASPDASWRWWQPAEGWSGSLPANNPFTYAFDKDEFGGNGLYIIHVQCVWQGVGNASYGFLIQVGAENLPEITRPSLPVQTPASVRLQSRSPLARLGKGAAESLALSKDGRWLAVNTPLGLYVYETATQEELWSMPLNAHGRTLAFSPDGEKLAVGAHRGGVLVVAAASGEELYHVPTGESGQPDWSPDGAQLLTGAGCEEVKTWDAATGAPLAAIHEAQCNNITPGIVRAVWSGDGSKVYVSGGNGYVLAYDARTHQPLAGYESHPPEFSFHLEIAPSPSQDLFALQNGLSVAIMDGSTGQLIKSLEGSRRDVPLAGITWSPDGSQIAAGNRYEIVLWDVETGKQFHTYPGFSPLGGLGWMPDGQTLVGLVAEDGRLSAVDVVTGETVFSLPGFGRVNSYSATVKWDGGRLLTVDGAHLLYWEARSGALLDQEPATIKPTWAMTSGYVLSPDAARYASPNAIYDTQSNQQIAALQDNPENGRDQVAWSPDGRVLASGHSLGFSPLVLWDAHTGQPLLEFLTKDLDLYLGGLAFSPDGKLLAGGGSTLDPASGLTGGILVLWDTQTGARTQILTAGMGSERIMALAWSADGRWLAAGMYSGRIVLWDMLTLQPVANLAGHNGSIIGLSWSPDSRLLASNSHGGTVLVWEAP
jgi:WD40 repeat protein